MASGSLFQKLKVATVTTIFVGSFFTQLAYADVKNSAGGFLDFNLYPYLSDVDSDNTATINIAAKLPNRISYFSLLNISNQNSAGALEETENFYLQDQGKQMHIVDDVLFFVIEEKNNSVDLTDRGLDLISPVGALV